MSFFNELKRRNVIKVAVAYMIVGWLIMQIGEVLSPALYLPGWVNSMLAFFIILGFPLALFFAWAFELTPDGIKKEHEVERSESVTHATGQKLNYTIMALMALVLGYFAFDKFVLDPKRDIEMAEAVQQAAPVPEQAEAAEVTVDDKSIAVLPFVNMSDDASNEFFSDGITEELLNLLAKIPELKVTSRSSAFAFKGQNIHIPTVAEKLKVAHILEGSVRKAGNRVRITAQLIKADSDVHMWSETFDRELDDIFAIQDEIAREVVTVLQVQLLGEVPVIAETDPQAYALYLQGKHHLARSGKTDMPAAIESFEKALEIDPDYAPAWAALGRTQRTMANWNYYDLAEGTRLGRESVLKALELDDTLAEAWAMLAHIQWVYDWDWDRAAGTARTALMHGPNSAKALEVSARIATTQGRMDGALEFALRAAEVDPLDPFILRTLAMTHWQRREFDKEREVFERLANLYPDRAGSYSSIAFAALQQGHPEEALNIALNDAGLSMRQLSSAFILPQLGRMEEGEAALQWIIDNSGDWLAYQVAEVYAFKGESDEAFEWLEISYGMRDGGISYLTSDFLLDSLHDDPRWEPFLLKVGLSESWQLAQEFHAESDR